MNYSCFIIKIISQPIYRFFENTILNVELIAKFPKIGSKSRVDYFKVLIWGNLTDEIMKYYKINDYLIIEGYIHLNQEIFELNNSIKSNQLQISIKKIYPFLIKNKVQ